ncbi:MAG: RdgB/HAM1 family non-canonical purine NTP pyrophosphatase [Proteobacteria bacterium]|nr:RdgB/HAM1 family non-canonical purine NTP pyrophosphatase [Pseudomonadota bacterium]
MNKVVLATGNPGKLREIRAMLKHMPWEILPQSEFDCPDAIEDGLSFVENAIKKARHACAFTGLASIADDSGLEVDALLGAPGIYSARYAGDGASDEDNLQKLLVAMKDVPEENRTARFRCVMVYMRHLNDPSPLICDGSWEGRIASRKQGENGFGYDPVFYVPTHDCSSAQLSPEQKNALSHRGQALRALAEKLSGTL